MRVTVPCFAKLNLDLRVLHKRSDGYHEIRTIFQTISLHDALSIDFEPSKRTQIDVESSLAIADNLVARAAELVARTLNVKAKVRFALRKRIPVGAGLGGGSSDAAAVLLSLPAIAGKALDAGKRLTMAESLGSDVPFFLLGGTALALGRGTELYPLPEQPARDAVVVSPGIHVSTGEAYTALRRPAATSLTSFDNSHILGEFQTLVRALGNSSLDELPLKNDFEEAIFGNHREVVSLVRRLRRLGARPAHMTGSGSAVFGIFSTSAQARAASAQFAPGTAFPVTFVSRRQYENAWQRALARATE